MAHIEARNGPGNITMVVEAVGDGTEMLLAYPNRGKRNAADDARTSGKRIADVLGLEFVDNIR
jgi:hypothetical protein